MKNKAAEQLLDKYLSGDCTPEERILVERAYNLKASATDPELTEERYAALKGEVWNDLQQSIPVRKIYLNWPRIAAAASILLILFIGGYFLLHKQSIQQIAKIQQHDIAPGRNQATLILANGEKIILTKYLNGNVAQQGNTAIQVNAGTALTYTSKRSTSNVAMQYNTLSTTRGQQSPYVLVLSDGTKVWLNAASSITYPVVFNGKDRTVKITGEAYFEVVHNAAQPFRVSVKDQTIEDIGTAFNINAYDDEPVMKTTLITGLIKVSNSKHSALMKPGQVAVTNPTQNDILVKDVDIEEATAWKNGYFLFDHENLESVMRKISRWYDVDIAYAPGQKITDNFLGSITRYGNVSQVLNMLQITGHEKFKIEGRKIIVEKK